MNKKAGFTFFELLIVILLISLTISVILPNYEKLYLKYKSAVEVEKLILFLYDIRRKAFQYSEDIEVFTIDNRTLTTSTNETFILGNYKIEMSYPIRFYSHGTSGGGEIVVNHANIRWKIVIHSPTGEITLHEI